MFNSQEQLLSSIAELVEDVIYTSNPNPSIYKDRDGKPLIGGNQYYDELLEETLIPVWNIHGTIYMVIVKPELNSYFDFTDKQFKSQFKKGTTLKSL